MAGKPSYFRLMLLLKMIQGTLPQHRTDEGETLEECVNGNLISLSIDLKIEPSHSKAGRKGNINILIFF
ncbi:hypothetical protein I7V34_13985 [Bacillus sp. V3]|nr:hypothetical protein I7V34_13985 [Bacillus sp. V3]